MRLPNWLQRPPPIRDLGELADFIDAHAAFVAQKGIYEYARARAGHYAKVLFAESGFQSAVERSRWQAYPLGLAMVGEAVEGLLRPHFGTAAQNARERLTALILSVLDRYPVSPEVGEAAWRDARRELLRRLEFAGMHAPKPAMDIPEPFAERYFALMPIHEKLRGRDFPTTRNYLRVTLCNVHDELTKRLDLPAIAAALTR